MKNPILLLPLVALLVAACGDSGSSSPGEPRAFDFSAFEAEVDAFLADTAQVDGVGAIIVHRDEGVIFRRGFGNYAEDRISMIASSSKMVTAGVLMALQDQGLLDVDVPIVQQLGDWGNHNPNVTPAQLVSNSSGFVGLGPEPAYGPYLCQWMFWSTLQDCARDVFTGDGDDADVIAPDTQFRYGGAQWQVAGAVAEIVSGKSWAQLIDEIYTQPCGLTAFGYANHALELTSPEGAFTHPPLEGDPSRLSPTENPNLEGGAYTNIADYGELLLMHLRGGMCGENRVLSEESVARLHADRIGEVYGGDAGGPGVGYGMGWWVDRDERGIIRDPGAFGSTAWLDEGRAYGAFLVIEDSSSRGRVLVDRTLPLIQDAIDAAG